VTARQVLIFLADDIARATMSTPNPSTAPTNGRPATESVPPNGQSGAAQAVPAAAAPSGKKGKAKKMPEPSEASKLIAQRISQLEMDAALDKDQEAELGG